MRWGVSIHAPWEGCDSSLLTSAKSVLKFQFTHPGKGATLTSRVARMLKRVSIHAPWEGCDRPFVGRSKRITSFNSRTLGRVRQIL